MFFALGCSTQKQSLENRNKLYLLDEFPSAKIVKYEENGIIADVTLDGKVRRIYFSAGHYENYTICLSGCQ
jgi:hypothetical protein